MTAQNRVIAAAILFLLAFTITPETANAKPNEFDAIAKHLKTKYQAKKVRVPFMWLAKFAVKIVRPAGVKSFNVTLFEDLKFSGESIVAEMQRAMRSSFGPEWQSVFRVRSQEGEQAYMYMREDGKNIKIALVTINRDEAALIRATFSPDKLAEFINNPKILGFSLGDGDHDKKKSRDKVEGNENNEESGK